MPVDFPQAGFSVHQDFAVKGWTVSLQCPVVVILLGNQSSKYFLICPVCTIRTEIFTNKRQTQLSKPACSTDGHLAWRQWCLTGEFLSWRLECPFLKDSYGIIFFLFDFFHAGSGGWSGNRLCCLPEGLCAAVLLMHWWIYCAVGWVLAGTWVCSALFCV